DFRPVQPSGNSNLDPLRSETLGILDGSSHCATESDSLFELLSNLLRLKLRVQLRLMDFLNVHVHFSPGAILDLLFELIDFSTLATDDNSRTRGVDDDLQLVGRALDINVRHSRACKATLQLLLEFQVFVQEIGIIAFGNPIRMPRSIEAQSKSI